MKRKPKRPGSARRPKRPRAGSARDLLAEVRDGLPDNAASVLAAMFRDATGKLFPYLTRAFDYFGLNPEREEHHRALLVALTAALFTDIPPGGREPEWHWDQLFELGHNHALVTAEKPQSDIKAADAIYKRFPGKYQSPEAIRQRLKPAKDCYRFVLEYAQAKGRGDL